MPDPLATINLRTTSQTVQADSRQRENNAGGFTFTIDAMTRLRRFLVLGTTGGTYYARESDLTKANADVVLELARTRGVEVVAEVVAISTAGRAPKQNPAIFALAAVAGLGSPEARKAAHDALPLVARTGTHLFLFARYVEQFRGWGRGLRRAVASWYTSKSADELAYQAAKYQQREGWSHRDLLRLSHPTGADDGQRAVFDFVAGRDAEGLPLPAMLDGLRQARTADSPATTARLVREFGLSWEMLNSDHLTSPEVWEALLDKGLPQTALMRQLPRLTRLGLLTGSRRTAVAAQLTDQERLRKARVHPINVLVAQRTYASGRSVRGDGEWTPVPAITDALDAAFYAAFGAVEPAGKRTRLALDVSGSMSFDQIAGLPITPREASAAMAMITMATEPEVDVVGFTSASRYGSRYNTGLTPLDISPRRRLDDVIRSISDLPFGGTDCALPMVDALAKGLEFDTFVVYTDNETWAGSIHPHQALRQYRERTGIDARLVVVGMTATEFSIADPTDAGMLDIAGFDSAAPSLISDFSRGSI
jgi:60 kDa SS-A/Ro ribonucleoprotein